MENEVQPGQEGTFTFSARTPATPGVRDESFMMLFEGLTWAQGPTVDLRINVL